MNKCILTYRTNGTFKKRISNFEVFIILNALLKTFLEKDNILSKNTPDFLKISTLKKFSKQNTN